MDSEYIDVNDPRLTAYVLGELDEPERELVEEHLQSSNAARAAVEEIRKTVATLEAHLTAEPSIELTAEQRDAIEAACLSPAKTSDSQTAAVAATVDDGVIVAGNPDDSAETIHPPRHRAALATGFATVAMIGLIILVVIGIEKQRTEPPFLMSENGDFTERDIARNANTVRFDISTGLADAEEVVSEHRRIADTSAENSEFDSKELLEEIGKSFDGAKPTHKGFANESQSRVSVRRENMPADGEASDKSFGRDPKRPGKNDTSQPQGGESGQSRVISGGGGGGSQGGGGDQGGGGKPQRKSGFAVSGLDLKEDLNGNGVLDPKAGRPKPIGLGSKPLPTSKSSQNGRALLGQSGESKALTAGTSSKISPSKEGRQPRNESTDLAAISGKPADRSVRYRRRIEEYYRQLHEVRGKKSQPQSSNESYTPIVENEFTSPISDPLSTLSVDVDTASYANVRRFLSRYQWPQPDAVRIEEMLNYFRYDYPQPEDGTPFSVNIEVAACPWQAGHRLARIGLKGKEILKDQRPPSNLVFLLDVSGSMRDANKLPLVKSSMEMLVHEMTEDDRIAIVTYSGKAGVRLQSTTGNDKETILDVIRGLNAGGSTNGEAGIKLAYDQALNHFIEKGTNRIILCTDGDFNVGVSNDNELVKMITDKARTGVFLSIFGFGMGNLKDSKLEKLADKGNGHYGYVDNISEAKKVFIEELTGMLYTIAKDVKVQVEFNPQRVGAYRLIGYENRVMAAQDFNNDRKDAGDIGAGHTVTALYEIIPPDKLPPLPTVDDLKYQPKNKRAEADKPKQADGEKPQEWADELFTVKLNYKQPDADQSQRLQEFPVKDQPDKKKAQPSRDFQWAASVASFGMLLRHSKHRGDANFAQVLEMALASKGPDKSGYRREFVDLVYSARAIQARERGTSIETPQPLSLDAGRIRAKVGSKYAKLLKTIEVPADWERYGTFNEFGHWSGDSYAGHKSLPEAYWVYVYPNWFLWEKQTTAKN